MESIVVSKNVLVLGSTGAMGQYIVPYLADMGYGITAVSLDDEKPYNDKVICTDSERYNQG